MRALKLGHAVLKVRSLAVSVPFYRDVIGLTEVARHGGRMAFFSCGENHHDLALLEIGAQAQSPKNHQVGERSRACAGLCSASRTKITGRFFQPCAA